MPGFKRVVILSDGIRGHFHQSLGLANWLERLEEVRLEKVIEVPKLRGIRKFIMMKILAGKIASRDSNYSRQWLKNSGASFGEFKPNTLFISTGSSAAPFCLALAKSTGNKAAVIMTPSVLGTKPFDFAVIPEHDQHDDNDKNIIVTLGAPNHIYRPDLKEESKKFFAGKDFTNQKVIALLIGGSDANYNLTPDFIEKVLTPLRNINHETRILITTSRRTGRAVDDVIEKIFTDCKNIDYMLLASREPDVNPIPAMLGAATHVLVSEDSVSMASESITAGFRIGLIRVPRFNNFMKKLLGYGASRFDDLFMKFQDKDLLLDLGRSPDYAKFIDIPEQKHGKNFNEARRAAECIFNMP